MKTTIKVIKKISVSAVLLYSYNLIATSYNLMIPINAITVGIASLLDIPGCVLMAVILKLYYWR